jgi:hypothetical protein
MRTSRVAILLWVVLIVVLLVVEIDEITHQFTIPVESALANPLALVIALVFTTLVALVGAIFIGIYVSHRILSPTGFTPFEEEMLRMRVDLTEVKRDLAALREHVDPPANPGPADDSPEPRR